MDLFAALTRCSLDVPARCCRHARRDMNGVGGRLAMDAQIPRLMVGVHAGTTDVGPNLLLAAINKDRRH